MMYCLRCCMKRGGFPGVNQEGACQVAIVRYSISHVIRVSSSHRASVDPARMIL